MFKFKNNRISVRTLIQISSSASSNKFRLITVHFVAVRDEFLIGMVKEWNSISNSQILINTLNDFTVRIDLSPDKIAIPERFQV